MTKKELIEILKPFPDDMEIWVSDRGYVEGGVRLEKVEKISSYEAGLDGDDIDDEYLYTEDVDDIQPYLDKGYLLSDNEEVLYKEIIYLNDLQ